MSGKWSTSPTGLSFDKLWGLHPATGNTDDYPLVQAQCNYRLVDVYLQADLTHTFISKAEYQSDVTYSLPLPPDASVHAFKALIDNHVVEGVVKEKAEARAAFEQAVSMNQKAALLQQENVEIFKLTLGNVSPGQNVAVHISFVSLISHEGVNDMLRLTFPTSIAPRYGALPGESFYRAGSLSNASTLEFSLSVEVGATITTINSPSHPISSHLGRSGPEDDSEFDVQKAFISLSSTTFLEKDIVIVLSCRNLDKQRCVVENSVSANGLDATEAYALTFVPRFKLPPLPRQEYLFLVDRSGSMEGGKMHALRSSLQIMLKSLPNSGSSFNLISFGSHQSALWATSMPYTEENVRVASAHVDDMIANYGGTEMKHALVTAFGSRVCKTQAAHTGVPTSVFVLTDGQCYDLDGVQSEIRSHVAQAKSKSSFLRVFCMGIGDAVSKGMCDAIARAGDGAAVFVGEMEKPDQKLMSLIRASAGPPIENLTIDWGAHEDTSVDDNMLGSASDPSPNVSSAPLSMFDEEYDLTEDMKDFGAGHASGLQQYPPAALMSTLVPGFRVSFFAIVTHSPGSTVERSRVVKLSATVQGQPLVLECPVSPITPVTAGTGMSTRLLHLIAARHLIQAHEDVHPITEAGKQEVLQLGLEYGLASSQTSFIAIDEVGQPKSLLFDNVPAPYNSSRLGSTGSYGIPLGSKPSYGFQSMGSRERERSMTSPAMRKSLGNVSMSLSPATTFGSASSMAQLPTSAGSAPPSWSSGSATMASPALSELSLHPQQYATSGGPMVQNSMIYSSPIEVSAPPLPMGGTPARAPPPLAMGFTRRGVAKKKSSGDSYTSKQKSTPTVERTLNSSIESLAREQAFDGSFSPSPGLFHLLTGNQSPSAMPSALKDLSTEESMKRKIWSTLLVIAYLQVNFATEEDAWIIFSEKALVWTRNALAQYIPTENRVDDVLKNAQDTAKGVVVKQ